MIFDNNFLWVNLSGFIYLAIDAVVIVSLLVFYRNSGHRGYVLIMIGQVAGFFWQLVYIFGFGGGLFAVSLVEQGMSLAEVGLFSSGLGLVSVIFTAFRFFLLVIGLAIISGDLARARRQPQRIVQQPFRG